MLLHGNHNGLRNFLYLKKLLQTPGEYYLPSGEYHLEISNPLSIASNVRIYGDYILFKVSSSSKLKHFALIDGEKNITIEGLRFESIHDKTDTSPKYGDFPSSNIRGFRVRGGSENINFNDLHFEQFDITIEVKENDYTSKIKNRNISLSNVTADRCILPLFFQQTEGLRLKNLDLDCKRIGGIRMKHIYISGHNSDMFGTNIICRRGQGYVIQILTPKDGGKNERIHFQNLTFDRTLFGVIIHGDLENLTIDKVFATGSDLPINEGLWINVSGGVNEERSIRDVHFSRWHINGGRSLYEEVANGSGVGINDITLDRFEVIGLTGKGIKHRYGKDFRLTNSIIDFDGFAPFLEATSNNSDTSILIDSHVKLYDKNKVLIRKDCKSNIDIRGVECDKKWLQDLRK